MGNPYGDKANAELIRECAGKWLSDMRSLLVVVHDPALADAIELCRDKVAELLALVDDVKDKAERRIAKEKAEKHSATQ